MVATRSAQSGFTYLMVLWWVAISSVALAAMGQQWVMESRRQREAELAFRGEQIKQAIDAYYASAPDGQPKVLPKRLEDLVEDKRQMKVKHHLRQLWVDPITGKPWGVVKAGEFIKGVYSTSRQKPIKAPGNAPSYQEWKFVSGQEIAQPKK